MLDDLKRALRMDSPTPRLSESNLKKLSRGLRSSKKSRLSVHSNLETHSVQDGLLGGRSVSLSTLLPSGGQHGVAPRVDKLQTLEAKMASIEVSLGWRRRREALLETLPRAARDLVRELDTLHQALKDKDGVIQALRTQITNLGGTVNGNGSEGGVGGGNGSQNISETEKRSVQDRLVKVHAEIEAKKVAIKNLKLALDKIDITDNIDVRIRAAELEYELEREELNILNLKEESAVLTVRLQETPALNFQNGNNTSRKTSTLHGLLSTTGGSSALAGSTLISVSFSHTPGNPPFHVISRPPIGCIIDWATDDTRLKKGDRLVEVNGEGVVGLELEDVMRLMATSLHIALVVARPLNGVNGLSGGLKKLEKQLEEKTIEVKDLVSRLDKSLKDLETARNDKTRLSHRISYLEEQVNDLQASLLKTRDVSTSDSRDQKSPTHPGATIIQVFQKGPQTVAVAGPNIEDNDDRLQQYPTLPRVKSPGHSSSASSCNTESVYGSTTKSQENLYQTTLNHKFANGGISGSVGLPNGKVTPPPHLSSRPSSAADRPIRRVISPRPESRGEESRPSSRNKPVPPKKPERLSLQRTTSLQSVEELKPSSRIINSSNRLPVLQNWPYIDTNPQTDLNQDGSGRTIGGKGEKSTNKMVVNVSNGNDATDNRYRHMSPSRMIEERPNLNQNSNHYTSPLEMTSPRSIFSTRSQLSPTYGSESGSNNSRFTNGTYNSNNNSIYSTRKDILNPPIKTARSDRRISLPTPQPRSPDPGILLESALDIDKHHDVRAEPLYSYLQESKNHRHYQERDLEEAEVIRPISTPRRTPRSSTIGVSSLPKKDEKWC